MNLIRIKKFKKQIYKIDENLKILKEEKNLNNYNKNFILENPSSKINQNIKKLPLKDNKQMKELLISKLIISINKYKN